MILHIYIFKSTVIPSQMLYSGPHLCWSFSCFCKTLFIKVSPAKHVLRKIKTHMQKKLLKLKDEIVSLYWGGSGSTHWQYFHSLSSFNLSIIPLIPRSNPFYLFFSFIPSFFNSTVIVWARSKPSLFSRERVMCEPEQHSLSIVFSCFNVCVHACACTCLCLSSYLHLFLHSMYRH